MELGAGLMHKEACCNNIYGIQVARNAPKVTHLLFTDGSLFFARANQKEADSINFVLTKYQLAFGQLVSLKCLLAEMCQKMRKKLSVTR